MKVHVSQIPVEGLHLEGEESASILDLHDASIKPAGPIRYGIDVGLSGQGLFATGWLAVELEMQCVNCLNRFQYPLRLESFALQTELSGSETVDLTPFVREDIVLALPAHPHCDWDGKKACKGAYKIEETAVSPAPSAWDELDKLKAKTKKQ